MSNYVVICTILALLGTFAVNPILWYCLFKNRRENKRSGKSYSIVCWTSNWAFLALNIVFFVLTFALSAFILYFLAAVSVRWSTILAYLWIPAISQVIMCLIFFFEDDSVQTCCIVTFILFFVIPLGIAIHKGVYNYNHPYENVTINEEVYTNVPDVDQTILLEKCNLASDASLDGPYYRNGNWVYVVKNDSRHVSSSGYIVIDSDGEEFIFTQKNIEFSPYITSWKNTGLVARRFNPSAVLFGSVTFQIEPSTGDVFFCKFYGDYACFRAGRIVEGALLINASTGECKQYAMNEIPSWVTGISF